MPYKIVVADPSPSVQKAAQLVFAEPEFRVFAYEDGASLLESVASVGPDALVVSLTLPGRDGYDVARTLRSRKQLASVPLVGLRGSFECIDNDRNAPSDYDEVLPKPFDSERLAAVVRELIARKTGPSSLPEEPVWPDESGARRAGPPGCPRRPGRPLDRLRGQGHRPRGDRRHGAGDREAGPGPGPGRRQGMDVEIMNTKDELAKAYDPKPVEEKWGAFWLDEGLFTADPKSAKPKFSMVLPPPNVTGILHMGHALCFTLPDIITRWKRMQGYNCLWLPGTDHASIAVHNVIEKSLAEKGLSREKIGRDEFLRIAWEWKAKYGGVITGQLKRLGASLDWSRERFTMDPGFSRAVKQVFVSLYDEGLIYRDYFLVNRCPHCRTVLSDIEIEHKDLKGKLWHIRYKVEGSDESVVVATTRPETMLGDTALAVHPDDERYAHLHGKRVILPLQNRPIPVITDERVERDFGTGAVKVTPAHDPSTSSSARSTAWSRSSSSTAKAR